MWRNLSEACGREHLYSKELARSETRFGISFVVVLFWNLQMLAPTPENSTADAIAGISQATGGRQTNMPYLWCIAKRNAKTKCEIFIFSTRVRHASLAADCASTLCRPTNVVAAVKRCLLLSLQLCVPLVFGIDCDALDYRVTSSIVLVFRRLVW